MADDGPILSGEVRRLGHYLFLNRDAKVSYEMKKKLLVVFTATLIAIGSGTSRAQTFPICTSQCDGSMTSCLGGCPASSNAVPDPHAACANVCYQGNANCRQNCIGLPLTPPARPALPLPPTPLNPG
jgi:hypothetical protein